MVFRLKWIFPNDNPERVDKNKKKIEDRQTKWYEYEEKKKKGYYKN